MNRMIYKPLIFIACFLVLLVSPDMSSNAQRSRDGKKKADVMGMVWVRPNEAKGSLALIPLSNAQIRVTLSDGQQYQSAPFSDELVLLKDLPMGCEYMAEISAKGYTTAIYHGRIPDEPGFRMDNFYTFKNPAAAATDEAPFMDPGKADVEGFVVCRADWQWVTEPLPDAFVLYKSSADSVYTTTDRHGYFRFNGIKDKTGKVSVSHMTCRSVEAVVPPEDGSRWLWLATEEDPLKLAAAQITASSPVLSVVGDTLRYHVASTQKVMQGDRLEDVLERLPGMTIENGAIMFLGKPIYEIFVNNSTLFWKNQRDALRYLAAQQINKVDVYEKEDEQDPQNGKRRIVMNVKTKRVLRSITDFDASVAGGGNMPLSSGRILPPERWQSGLGARYFSVPALVTIDLGTNNLGIDYGKDLSKIQDTGIGEYEYIKPVFASIDAQKALELNKEKNRAIQSLSFNYYFKKREARRENETERSYDPDDDWIRREYKSLQWSSNNNLTHRGEIRWNSEKKWHPHASVAYSHNESGQQSDYFSMDDTQSADQENRVITLHQVSELKARNYTIEGTAGAYMTHIPNLSINFNLSFNGGEGDGSEIRSDSTSTQNTWIISDEGKNRHFTANAGFTRFKGSKRISVRYVFNHDYGLQRKLKYDEVIEDAHLSPLTSEDNRSNLYRHTIDASYNFDKFAITTGVRATHVLDSRELPYQEEVNKFFLAPVFNFIWMPLNRTYKRFSLRFDALNSAPSLNQLGSVFHDSNPHAVSRGNPNLKQMHTLSLSASGNTIIPGGILNYDSRFSYRINEFVSTRAYYAKETDLDGYTLPAGSTFSSFTNSTGGMIWNNNVKYSAFIKALRYKMDFTAIYAFSRSPSYVNERFEHYISHSPQLRIDAISNFSSRYKLNFSVFGSMNLTDSPYYGSSGYSHLSASVNSDNRITKWLFVRASYMHSTRNPMSERLTRMDTEMLNASTGVFLLDSRLCIALIFRDILNNAPRVRTTAYSNFLETVRTANMNRYMLLSIRYVFNSSEK